MKDTVYKVVYDEMSGEEFYFLAESFEDAGKQAKEFSIRKNRGTEPVGKIESIEIVCEITFIKDK